MDDRRLVVLATKAKKGNLGAFEELYSVHAQSILFHTRSLIYDKENYIDVAQDIVIRLNKRIGNLKEPRAFRGWMHRTIRNVCFDYNRSHLQNLSQKRSEEAEEQLKDTVDKSEALDPTAVWDDKLESNAIYAAICELLPDNREVLFLRHYDELLFREIAFALNVSINVVKVRLQRATEAMRQVLAGKEAEALNQNETPESKNSPTNKAIKEAVAVLIPPTLVEEFVAEVNIKLAAIASKAKERKETAAKVAANRKVIAVLAGAVLLSLVSLGLYWYGVNEEAPTIETEAVEELPGFEGTVSILFVDANGEDTDAGVTNISIVEEGTTTTTVSYVVTDEAGEFVLIGNDREITSTDLEKLEPGTYKVSFTLIDKMEESTTAHRTFRIS